jgi:hypothetical protein
MATLGELFFGRELVELMDEMEEALEFLELFEEDKTIDEKEITLTIKTKNTKGEIQTADLTIPPEMERYVKKMLKKKMRLIKRKGGLLAWLLC